MTGTLHGTVVALDDAGVLLRGPSGSGKSDLALRLLAGGWLLVADDRVALMPAGGDLVATAPQPLAGLLEVRGLGVVKTEAGQRCEGVTLRLVVDLVADRDGIERMPEADFFRHAGIRLPLIRLYPFDESATARLAMALAVTMDPDRRVE